MQRPQPAQPTWRMKKLMEMKRKPLVIHAVISGHGASSAGRKGLIQGVLRPLRGSPELGA